MDSNSQVQEDLVDNKLLEDSVGNRQPEDLAEQLLVGLVEELQVASAEQPQVVLVHNHQHSEEHNPVELP